MMLHPVQQALRHLANKELANVLARFFKTGKGEYGEGDQFLGIYVPKTRKIAKYYKDTSLAAIAKILQSPVHEDRLAALLILVHQFQEADDKNKKALVDFYLGHTVSVNNWDLVDLTADKLLGAYLVDKDKSLLYLLAKSSNLWERRIAMVSTFAFIRHDHFTDTLKLAEILLHDQHDLIHKAVGWMLREVGKRDQAVLGQFLEKHHTVMPRTMLRYAVERLNKEKKIHYMKKERS